MQGGVTGARFAHCPAILIIDTITIVVIFAVVGIIFTTISTITRRSGESFFFVFSSFPF